ncbi:MAG: 4'-phosphopantetheinyl transferase superfamily protein [Desulfobulbaceae bacterium]|nr:MAG: 4'-phosphopantetheinyl transferase superfamily protein [Desulfobulbaceae bacterium]
MHGFISYSLPEPLRDITLGSLPAAAPADRCEFAHLLLLKATVTPPLKSSPILSYDNHGKPHTNRPDQAISFSTCNSLIYGAVSPGTALGIDGATRNDFDSSYPYNRVFHLDELDLGSSVLNEVDETAAFVWACKESVVKARGSGFRGITPKDLRLVDIKHKDHCYRATITLFSQEISTLVVSLGSHWLAICRENPSHICNWRKG